MSCIKKNTILSSKREEAMWFFWIETMKQTDKWLKYIPDKIEHKGCYECTKEWTNECTKEWTNECTKDKECRWINPASYEVVLDMVIRNVYCDDCYKEWTEQKNEQKNELKEIP